MNSYNSTLLWILCFALLCFVSSFPSAFPHQFEIVSSQLVTIFLFRCIVFCLCVVNDSKLDIENMQFPIGSNNSHRKKNNEQ